MPEEYLRVFIEDIVYLFSCKARVVVAYLPCEIRQKQAIIATGAFIPFALDCKAGPVGDGFCYYLTESSHAASAYPIVAGCLIVFESRVFYFMLFEIAVETFF